MCSSLRPCASGAAGVLAAPLEAALAACTEGHSPATGAFWSASRSARCIGTTSPPDARLAISAADRWTDAIMADGASGSGVVILRDATLPGRGGRGVIGRTSCRTGLVPSGPSGGAIGFSPGLAARAWTVSCRPRSSKANAVGIPILSAGVGCVAAAPWSGEAAVRCIENLVPIVRDPTSGASWARCRLGLKLSSVAVMPRAAAAAGS